MRIAVTGSTGFVGSNVATVLQQFGHEVLGLTRKPGTLPWPGAVVDFADSKSIAKELDGFDAVVHCAISNDFNRLMNDRPYSYDSYVGMTSRVVTAAIESGTKPIYISTDWVMDGTGHLYGEDDPGNPVNIYGFLKAMGEQVVKDLAPDSGAICRIGGVMGNHQTQQEGPRSQDVGFGYFVTALVNQLKRGQRFDVWGGDQVNKVATPSLASEIGAQIERVASLNATGTFHLVGDDAVERSYLANLTAEIFELDSSLIGSTLPPESELFPAQVPVDTSLSNIQTKKQLKLKPTGLRDLLVALRSEMETGRLSPLTQRL